MSHFSFITIKSIEYASIIGLKTIFLHSVLKFSKVKKIISIVNGYKYRCRRNPFNPLSESTNLKKQYEQNYKNK